MKIKKMFAFLFLAAFAMLILLPLWMILTGSFMGTGEIREYVGPVLSEQPGAASWNLIPQYPTMKPYVELLLDSPSFFVMFLNSCKQVFPILIGQLIVGVPAAWAFGRFQFPGKRILFLIYLGLMIMPFQVTMVSSYLVIDKLRLMDSHLAVVLPAVFSTFPIFIMTKFFSSIPIALVEAAELDGAGDLQIFMRIGIPMGVPGIISAVILGFLEYWNAMEAPLTFLSDKSKWPLSLYLPSIATDQVGVSMVASVLMMAPALLLFFVGQTYLEQGIQASGIKE